MSNLNHLARVSETSYTAQCAAYSNLSRLLSQAEGFENWVFNAAIRYVESGDPVHLNRVIRACEHSGRAGIAIVRRISAHSWDKVSRTFGGKAKKAKLSSLRTNGEMGIALYFGDATRKAKHAPTLEQLEARAAKAQAALSAARAAQSPPSASQWREGTAVHSTAIRSWADTLSA